MIKPNIHDYAFRPVKGQATKEYSAALEKYIDYLEKKSCKHSKIGRVTLAKVNGTILQCVDCGQTIEELKKR